MQRDPRYKSEFWYLTTVLKGTQNAPDLYKKYLDTQDIKDYSRWLIHHLSAMGLAIICDFELSDNKDMEDLFNDYDKVLEVTEIDLEIYREQMRVLHLKTKDIFMCEIYKHGISSQQDRDYYAEIIGYLGDKEESSEILPFFIDFLNKELKN